MRGLSFIRVLGTAHMDLLETAILGEDVGSHWYYKSKSEFMLRALGENTPTEVLDVGAGSGYFAKCPVV